MSFDYDGILKCGDASLQLRVLKALHTKLILPEAEYLRVVDPIAGLLGGVELKPELLAGDAHRSSLSIGQEVTDMMLLRRSVEDLERRVESVVRTRNATRSRMDKL